MAFADTILQMPPLTSNLFQSWCEGDCATLYDEADRDNIKLLPRIGDRKKLVVGEQYQLIVEADQLEQYNPCSHGRGVTGEGSFKITGVTVGQIDDKGMILNQFETGELVTGIDDNGTDYSTVPIVAIDFAGVDYYGPVSGSAEFEIE